jgi:hypothetical protein
MSVSHDIGREGATNSRTLRSDSLPDDQNRVESAQGNSEIRTPIAQACTAGRESFRRSAKTNGANRSASAALSARYAFMWTPKIQLRGA